MFALPYSSLCHCSIQNKQYHKVLFKSIHRMLWAVSFLILENSTLLRFHRVLHERDSMKGNKVVAYTYSQNIVLLLTYGNSLILSWNGNKFLNLFKFRTWKIPSGATTTSWTTAPSSPLTTCVSNFAGLWTGSTWREPPQILPPRTTMSTSERRSALASLCR